VERSCRASIDRRRASCSRRRTAVPPAPFDRGEQLLEQLAGAASLRRDPGHGGVRYSVASAGKGCWSPWRMACDGTPSVAGRQHVQLRERLLLDLAVALGAHAWGRSHFPERALLLAKAVTGADDPSSSHHLERVQSEPCVIIIRHLLTS
jgi:hypothetical protein